MAKKVHFLTGVILGALAGTAAALFTAPKKGSDLREDASNKYNDLKGFSVDRFNDVKSKFDTGEYSAEKVKEYLQERGDAIKEAVASGDLPIESVKEFVNKTKISLSDKFEKKSGETYNDKLSYYNVWTENAEKGTNKSRSFFVDKIGQKDKAKDLTVNYIWSEGVKGKSDETKGSFIGGIKRKIGRKEDRVNDWTINYSWAEGVKDKVDKIGSSFATHVQTEIREKIPVLELKGIKKSYLLGKEKFPVLKGIDLTFDRGDFTSLLGESGGGKTTLMNIIGGLDREYEGDVLINGVVQKSKKEKDMDAYRRDMIGFIFQSFNLISYLSVLDNILIALKMTNLTEKERQQRGIELTKQVGLYEHRKKKPAQLSGGQKQRVAIARALANDPEIILADEPTGALDSQNTCEVLKILQDIAKSGKTVIVVTHSQEVADSGTRIIRLADGKITDDKRIHPSHTFREEKKSYATKALSYGDVIKTAFKHFINAWKINLLIAIGTAIGLFSVIFFLGLGTGGTRYMNDTVTSVANPNVLLVVRRSIDNQGEDNDEAFQNAYATVAQDSSSISMTRDYIDKIEAVKNVEDVQSMYIISVPTQLMMDGETVQANQFHSWTDLMQSSSLSVGRIPGKNEIVLQESYIRRLDPKAFEDKNWQSVIDRIIEVTFTLPTKSGPKQVTQSMKVSGVIQDNPIAAPMTSFETLKSIYNENEIDDTPNFAVAIINQTDNVRQATKDIEKLKTGDKKVFAIQGVGSILNTITDIMGIVSTILVTVSGISLIVSIFMIVVTIYMSVAERTKEIGIIRALGGRKRDISQLFTAESIILGLSSALIAIVLAFPGEMIINKILYQLVGGDIVQITGMHIFFAVIIALVIAFFSSFAPSIRAARLNTIEALANE